ncbi:unnamed protein product, partial [Porites evermanni]
MGINKRGVLRGKCSESECECEEFESVCSIVCEYCGHPPVKHEKHTGLSEEFPDSSYSPSDPVVPTIDSTAAVSNSLTIESVNPQTSSEYPLAAKNVISFLKNVAKEEGDLSSPVLRYHLSITEEEKLKVTCKVCKKISCICRVKYQYIWLSGQRNPFDNAKQHVESKAQKTKMHGSSMVSSKDISSYFQAPLQKEPHLPLWIKKTADTGEQNLRSVRNEYLTSEEIVEKVTEQRAKLDSLESNLFFETSRNLQLKMRLRNLKEKLEEYAK